MKRIAANMDGLGNEERKPVLGGPNIYVGTFVAPNSPGNDPNDASYLSPPWLNGFYYVAGSPIWFAHGVDGETDMGGAYDLISGSPVSGTVAFVMPLEWAVAAAQLHSFPVLLEEGTGPADYIFGTAVQYIDSVTGNVRIYWPTVATPYP